MQSLQPTPCSSAPSRLFIDQSGEQRVVRVRRRDALVQPLHRRLRRHLGEAPPQRVYSLELLRLEQLLLATRAARRDVDRGIDPLVRERAVQLDLAVAGALELLEDY